MLEKVPNIGMISSYAERIYQAYKELASSGKEGILESYLDALKSKSQESVDFSSIDKEKIERDVRIIESLVNGYVKIYDSLEKEKLKNFDKELLEVIKSNVEEASHQGVSYEEFYKEILPKIKPEVVFEIAKDIAKRKGYREIYALLEIPDKIERLLDERVKEMDKRKKEEKKSVDKEYEQYMEYVDNLMLKYRIDKLKDIDGEFIQKYGVEDINRLRNSREYRLLKALESKRKKKIEEVYGKAEEMARGASSYQEMIKGIERWLEESKTLEELEEIAEIEAEVAEKLREKYIYGKIDKIKHSRVGKFLRRKYRGFKRGLRKALEKYFYAPARNSRAGVASLDELPWYVDVNSYNKVLEGRASREEAEDVLYGAVQELQNIYEVYIGYKLPEEVKIHSRKELSREKVVNLIRTMEDTMEYGSLAPEIKTVGYIGGMWALTNLLFPPLAPASAVAFSVLLGVNLADSVYHGLKERRITKAPMSIYHKGRIKKLENLATYIITNYDYF